MHHPARSRALVGLAVGAVMTLTAQAAAADTSHDVRSLGKQTETRLAGRPHPKLPDRHSLMSVGLSAFSVEAMLWPDADPSTTQPEATPVKAGGTLTLTMPSYLGLGSATGTYVRADGSTQQAQLSVTGQTLTLAVPASLPDELAMVDISGAMVSGAPVASASIGFEVSSTAPDQVSSPLRVFSYAQYTGAPLTMIPGKPLTVKLSPSDPIVERMANQMTAVSPHFGPFDTGAPFEVPSAGLTPSFDAAANTITVTLPVTYPTTAFPADQDQTLSLDAVSFADPSLGYLACDIPVTLVSRYQAVVSAAYRDVLGRAVTASAGSYWNKALENGTTRLALGRSLATSTEYRTKMVKALFSTALKRSANSTEISNRLAWIGRGATTEQVHTQVLASDEFYRKAGGTRAGYATALYRTLLNRDPSASELTTLTRALASGRSRTAVAGALVASNANLIRVIDAWYVQTTGQHVTASYGATLAGRIRSGTSRETILASLVASNTYFTRAG